MTTTSTAELVAAAAVGVALFIAWRVHELFRALECAVVGVEGTARAAAASTGRLAEDASSTLEKVDALAATLDALAATLEATVRAIGLRATDVVASTSRLVDGGARTLERLDGLVGTLDDSAQIVVAHAARDMTDLLRTLQGIVDCTEGVAKDARILLKNTNTMVETMELKRVPAPFRRLCCLRPE